MSVAWSSLEAVDADVEPSLVFSTVNEGELRSVVFSSFFIYFWTENAKDFNWKDRLHFQVVIVIASLSP